jgi:hypothetical protein
LGINKNVFVYFSISKNLAFALKTFLVISSM